MSESPSPDAVAGRGAMLAARILLGLATLLTVLAIFALWVNRQALDTNDWTRTSTRLLQDARVRSTLSTYLVDQLYVNVDVAGELRSLAPKDLKPLAGPAAGRLRVLRSDQIKTVQRIVRALRGLVVILLILVPALYAAAVVLADGRRRQMLMAIGFCFIGAGLVVLILRGLMGDYVVGALINTGTDRPAADAVWSIGTSVLVDVAQSSVVVGIPFVAAAWVAGPTKWAANVRRELAGPMAERPAYVWSAVAAILLLLIIWEPIRAFRNP